MLPSEKLKAEAQFVAWARSTVPGLDVGIFNFLVWLEGTTEGQAVVRKLERKEVT